MHWFKSKILPKQDVRVLVYAPEHNDCNRFRIIDSKFVKICTDVTHWAYLDPPPLDINAPILVLIRGLPGSGKSTLVKNEFKDFCHYEADQYFTNEKGEYDYSPIKGGTAHAICQFRTFTSLLEGRDTVVSNTFVKVSMMLPYIHFAQDNNIPWTVIECTGTWKNIHNVPEEILTMMRDTWEKMDILTCEKGYFDPRDIGEK